MSKLEADNVRTPRDDTRCLWCHSTDHKTVDCLGTLDWFAPRPPASAEHPGGVPPDYRTAKEAMLNYARSQQFVFPRWILELDPDYCPETHPDRTA